MTQPATKILYISCGLVGGENPGVSGGDIRMLELMSQYQSLGYELHFYTNRAGRYLAERFNLSCQFHDFGFEAGQSRLDVIRMTVHSIFNFPTSLLGFRGIVFTANEMLVDVAPAVRLKRMNKNEIEWGSVVHWLPPSRFWQRKESGILVSFLFYLNNRLSLLLCNRWADRLLAVSRTTRESLDIFNNYSDKNVTVECGIPFSRRHDFRINSDIRYDVIYLKRIQRVKGIFDLVKVWPRVLETIPDATLLIVGDGIDAPALMSQINDLGLERSVTFDGPVYDYDKKFQLLYASLVFALPSYEENWAIGIGEALMSQCKVCAYDLPELRAVWGEHISYSETGNLDELSRSIIEQVLASRQSGSKMESRAVDRLLASIDWLEVAKKELNSLSGLAEKSR